MEKGYFGSFLDEKSAITAKHYYAAMNQLKDNGPKKSKSVLYFIKAIKI